MSVKYEEDFYGWIFGTIELLKAKKFDELDVDKLVDELKSLSEDKSQLLNDSLYRLIAYLLQWQYQKESRGRILEDYIQELRKRVKKLLLESPCLETIGVFLEDAYEYSVLLIKQESYIETSLIPQECPYTFEQIMDDQFYPE